jgi:hypothetical protein
MPSFDLLLRRITPRQSVPAVPPAPVATPIQAIVEPPPPEEPGFFRQALIEARVQWVRDVQRVAKQQAARPSAPTERVVFTDQYVPPPPKRPSGASDAIGWWD